MKCVCPMGGDRTCPDDCPLAVWALLSASDRKAQRKSVAEKLYKKNMTMEQIATQLGVNHGTISRDLKEFVHDAQTQPRTSARGRKGEGRPKGKRKSKPRQTAGQEKTIVALADKGMTSPKIANELGVNGRAVRHTLEEEVIRKQAFEEVLGAAAAERFSKSGALRIEDAIRIHKERLTKSFEQQVGEEVLRRIAAADDATRYQNKQLREENLRLQTMLNQRGVFSDLQFKHLLMCVHPENSASVSIRNELLPFINKNKQRLVKT